MKILGVGPPKNQDYVRVSLKGKFLPESKTKQFRGLFYVTPALAYRVVCLIADNQNHLLSGRKKQRPLKSKSLPQGNI